MASEREALILQPKSTDDEFVVVENSPFRVGRRSNNDLRLNRSDVSSFHATLVFDETHWCVKDHGSTNGTFVNGERIRETTRLQPGDILNFATTGFEVMDADEWMENTQSGSSITAVLTDPGDIQGMVDLYNIIHDGRTFSVFQPVVDLRTQETFGWEALGRGATYQPVDPGTMFRLATKNGVQGDLSAGLRQSALECAVCRFCWPQAAPSHLFFNLHPTEASADRYAALLETLSTSELSRSYTVVLEIHESLVADAAAMKELVGSARAAGLLVAYDDFGAGQSRLPDLLNVPPDFLKLDRGLVTDLATDDVKRKLIQAVVDACRELGVKTLAEGIETEVELRACQQLEIDLGQGYLLSRPMAPFKLFSVDTATLPSSCSFMKLGVVDAYR